MGFTLIEIMIVVGIIVIVMAFGIPAFVDALKRRPMGAATLDLQNACLEARKQAIKNGAPTELVLTAEGRLSVTGAGAAFDKQLDPEIKFDEVYVNRINVEEDAEARVHFFPNGTSDEFNVRFHSSQRDQRRIWLDVATALPQLEVIQ